MTCMNCWIQDKRPILLFHDQSFKSRQITLFGQVFYHLSTVSVIHTLCCNNCSHIIIYSLFTPFNYCLYFTYYSLHYIFTALIHCLHFTLYLLFILYLLIYCLHFILLTVHTIPFIQCLHFMFQLLFTVYLFSLFTRHLLLTFHYLPLVTASTLYFIHCSHFTLIHCSNFSFYTLLTLYLLSTLAVASSSTSIGDFLSMALARQNSCLCPTLKLEPLSVTLLSSPPI